MGFVNGASRWDELIKPSLKNSENTFSSAFHPKWILIRVLGIFRLEESVIVEQAAVKQAIRSPISKFAVNASLMLRVTVRRLLKIRSRL